MSRSISLFGTLPASYEHDLDLITHLASGIGAQFTVYSTPVSLQREYEAVQSVA